MNQRELEDFLAATEGHTPGPWTAYRRDPSDDYEHKWDGIGPIGHDNPCHDDDSWVCATESDATLAAAAPDLLEEIKRLRAWLAHVSVCAEWVCSGAATGIYVTEIVDAVTAALNGEVVPE